MYSYYNVSRTIGRTFLVREIRVNRKKRKKEEDIHVHGLPKNNVDPPLFDNYLAIGDHKVD